MSIPKLELGDSLVLQKGARWSGICEAVFEAAPFNSRKKK